MRKPDRNNWWPDDLWLVGDTYAKQRANPKDPSAVRYVRADIYDELLEWTSVMIIAGEACPCSRPEPAQREDLCDQQDAQRGDA